MQEKVLVVSRKVFFDLYRNGLLDYAESNNMQIDLYYLDYPKEELSLLDKIRYKYNINDFKDKYYDEKRNELCVIIDNYDQILFINLFYDEEYFIKDKLKEKLKTRICKLLFVDSLKTINQNIDFFDIFDKIYSFEYQDIEFAKTNFNVHIEYTPVGTSYYLYKDNTKKEKIYDICFVGIATKKRLEYLDEIAKWCYENNKNLFIAGHFWHNNNILNYYIGKIKFKIKYPILYKYVRNKFIEPKALAKIYQQSKICLNINVEYHKSFNPRNFDIIYSDSILLTDTQDTKGIDLKKYIDFICFDDKNDFINKVAYCLNKDNEKDILRLKENGKEKINKKYLFSNTLCIIFNKG